MNKQSSDAKYLTLHLNQDLHDKLTVLAKNDNRTKKHYVIVNLTALIEREYKKLDAN